MEKTARNGAAVSRAHERDEDCDVNPETDTCRECGTEHGDPCPHCEARAFHRKGCPDYIEAPTLNEVHPIPVCADCGSMILGEHQCPHTANVADVLRDDKRFTAGLMFDLFAVLERHGYERHGGDRQTAQAMLRCLQLVRAFEGHDDRNDT